jgi:hypothetical protein
MYLVHGHGHRGLSAGATRDLTLNDGGRYTGHLKILDSRVGRGSRVKHGEDQFRHM